jgi:GTPase SAR1 family protein
MLLALEFSYGDIILCNAMLYIVFPQECSQDFPGSTYPGTDVFVVCFSVARPESFENVQRKWVPEIKRQMGDIPFIMVGTQADLRQADVILRLLREKHQSPITQNQGADMARRVGAACYIECSPELEKRTKRDLNKALLTVLQPRGEVVETMPCSIL